MELTIHKLFDPAFREATTFRSFERLEVTPVRMGMIGDDSDPVASQDQHAEARVQVPDGSVVQVCADDPDGCCGTTKLVVPKRVKPLSADEVWDLARSVRDGFAIL